MSHACQYLRFALLAVITLLSGCSNDGKIDVQGTATWNGEPISKGYVEVSPLDGKGHVDGANIADGTFTIRTNEGQKRVSVVAQRQIGTRPPDDRVSTPEPIYFQYLPTEFNEASNVKVAISADEPTLVLDLKGKERPQGLTASERARLKKQGGTD